MAALVLGNKGSDKDFIKGTLYPPLNVSASTTLTAALSNSIISVTLAAAAVTVTLPTAAQGQRYKFIIAASGTTGVLTVSGAAANLISGLVPGAASVIGKISAATSVVLPVAPPVGSWLSFECFDGTNWSVSGQIGQGLGGAVTAVATANNTTAAETDLLAGATAIPATTTLSAHAGFAIPANTLAAGKMARIKLYGIYTTAGATATITPALRFNTAAATTVVGTGQASGTFASGAGPLSWAIDGIILMLDGTHMLTSGNLIMAGEDPATTVAAGGGFASVAGGVVIDPTVAGNICPTWTGSSANAGNTFQCFAGTLEFLN